MAQSCKVLCVNLAEIDFFLEKTNWTTLTVKGKVSIKINDRLLKVGIKEMKLTA